MAKSTTLKAIGWIAASFCCGAFLTAAFVCLHVQNLNRTHKAQLDYQAMTSRCFLYWGSRSPISDAEIEFRHNRTGLLEYVSYGEVATVSMPGLKRGMTATARRDFPLRGPKVEDLDRDEHTYPPTVRTCKPYAYEFDYNITMLRLLGRSSDIEFRPSAEIK